MARIALRPGGRLPARCARAALIVLALGAGACAGDRGADTRTAASGPRWFGDVTPPEDNVLRFANGAEPERIDPGLMSGQPDGRVARMLFEGLVTPDPQTLESRPGQAYRWETSADGRTVTFHLRPGLVWSDGVPLTARDFVWSWTRVLTPATASRYGTFLYAIANAEDFHKGRITDPARLGLAAPDDSTFVVTLANPTPYFVSLTQYYTCLPVPRHVIEKHGDRWWRPEHLVNNGPFKLDVWRQRDRFEFVRNPTYWDAASVRLDRIIAYSLEDLNTCTNLYKAGVIDWNPSGYIPAPFLPYMQGYADYHTGRYQSVYFYSVNLRRKPLDNVHVRRALNLAIDREAIVRDLFKGTHYPWGNFAPSGYPDYTNPPGVTFDPERARAELAQAGYPGGQGLPKISILFNTSENHRRVAEVIQQMWHRHLGIDVELSNQEWGSYLQATTALEYDVARRSWIGDYLDPHTFLSIMKTGDGNNRTGWGDPRYDALLTGADRELDPAKRARMLAEAETLLLESACVLPIYQYASTELIKPYVRGIYPTALDTHPLTRVWIDRDWKITDTQVAGGARR
jgi:oligopeptide transport system substrate-binding protein